MPKRGDRVAPPARTGDWELKHTTDSIDGWESLCKQARNATRDAWEQLSKNPIDPTNLGRQHRLKGDLSSRTIGGKKLDQWQYEVTGGGRIWYCPDVDTRVVYLTLASVAHPKKTE